jgi:hypothetical protein
MPTHDEKTSSMGHPILARDEKTVRFELACEGWLWEFGGLV